MTTNPILSAEDYLSLPREPESWLLKPLLPAGGSMILYGDPKVGKSYAAIQLALTLAGAQTDWLGFRSTRSGAVVYVQLDTPRSLWAERLEALRAEGLPIAKLHLADRETLGTWPFDILNPDHEHLLRAALAPIKPIAVVLDVFKETNSADENSNTEMVNVMNHLIAATQPAAMILVAHSKKPSADSGPDLINDSRGAGAIVGKLDAICRLTSKGLYYVGRGIEKGSIKVQRCDNGLWEEKDDLAEGAIEEVMCDPLLLTQRARAEALAAKLGVKPEAARSLLRRRRR